jgi:hypothetical protein
MNSLALIINQVKSEIAVDTDGRGKASVRATARLLGIDEKSLRTAFDGAEQKPSKLATFLINKGFEGAEQTSWTFSGVPDIAIAHIAKYYGYKAGRYCTDQAEMVDAAFTSIGVRTWIQKAIGWEKAEVTTVPPTNPNQFILTPSNIASTIDAILGGTDVDPYLIAGVKANCMANKFPELKELAEETKKLLPLPVEDRLVTVTSLAAEYNARHGKQLSAVTMNRILLERGFQIKNAAKNPCYLPTEKGNRYGKIVLQEAKSNNTTVQQLRWYMSILEVI